MNYAEYFESVVKPAMLGEPMNLILKEKFKHTDGDRINTLKVKPQPDGTMIVWIYNGERSTRFTLQANTASELRAFLEHHRVMG